MTDTDQAEPEEEKRVPLKPPPPPDPEVEIMRYINTRWVQLLSVLRTECIICHKQSPVIYIDLNGAKIAFNDPGMLRRGPHRYRDVAREVAIAFAEHGWKFQRKRSYCPDCKGLNSV